MTKAKKSIVKKVMSLVFALVMAGGLIYQVYENPSILTDKNFQAELTESLEGVNESVEEVTEEFSE